MSGEGSLAGNLDCVCTHKLGAALGFSTDGLGFTGQGLDCAKRNLRSSALRVKGMKDFRFTSRHPMTLRYCSLVSRV